MPRIHPMCDAMATASHRFLTSFPTEFAKAVAAIHHLKPKATPSAAVGAPEPVAGDDDKLLPCLSCGCEQVELITSYSYGSEMFHVRCGNCMMRTERSCGKSKVVETWNSRDGSTVPRAEYDRVVKLMNHFRDVIAEYHDMATADSKPTNVHNPESEDTPSHNPVLGPVVGTAKVSLRDWCQKSSGTRFPVPAPPAESPDVSGEIRGLNYALEWIAAKRAGNPKLKSAAWEMLNDMQVHFEAAVARLQDGESINSTSRVDTPADTPRMRQVTLREYLSATGKSHWTTSEPYPQTGRTCVTEVPE